MQHLAGKKESGTRYAYDGILEPRVQLYIDLRPQRRHSTIGSRKDYRPAYSIWLARRKAAPDTYTTVRLNRKRNYKSKQDLRGGVRRLDRKRIIAQLVAHAGEKESDYYRTDNSIFKETVNRVLDSAL